MQINPNKPIEVHKFFTTLTNQNESSKFPVKHNKVPWSVSCCHHAAVGSLSHPLSPFEEAKFTKYQAVPSSEAEII